MKGQNLTIAEKREKAKQLPGWVVKRRGWTEAELRHREKRFKERHKGGTVAGLKTKRIGPR